MIYHYENVCIYATETRYDNEVLNGKLILNQNKYFDIVCIFSWIIKLKQQHG